MPCPIAIPGLAMLKSVPKGVWLVGALVAAVIAFLVWNHFDNKQAIEQANRQAEVTAGKAREKAADERLADTLVLEAEEKELKDVINQAPESDLSPAAHARACELLRRQGRIPSTCGPQGN